MKELSMLKIKEILRLKCEAKLSNRKIARALNISHSVVNEYTKEFKLTTQETCSKIYEVANNTPPLIFNYATSLYACLGLKKVEGWE